MDIYYFNCIHDLNEFEKHLHACIYQCRCDLLLSIFMDLSLIWTEKCILKFCKLSMFLEHIYFHISLVNLNSSIR